MSVCPLSLLCNNLSFRCFVLILHKVRVVSLESRRLLPPRTFCFKVRNGKKISLWDHLAVCLYVYLHYRRQATARLLGNDSENTFPQQRIHTQQWKNCWTRCFLCSPFRIKYSIRSEKIVEDWVARLPESWDNKILSHIPRDSEPRMNVLAKTKTFSVFQTIQRRMIWWFMEYDLGRVLKETEVALSRYYHRIRLEGPRKPMKMLREDSRCCGRDSNRAQVQSVTAIPTCSVFQFQNMVRKINNCIKTENIGIKIVYLMLQILYLFKILHTHIRTHIHTHRPCRFPIRHINGRAASSRFKTVNFFSPSSRVRKLESRYRNVQRVAPHEVSAKSGYGVATHEQYSTVTSAASLFSSAPS
jgi:hypothetical protein